MGIFNKRKRFLRAKKYWTPEPLKRELDEKGLKYGLFVMHERDLPRFPWIKKAIVDLDCASIFELNEQELSQFYMLSAGTSGIILPLTSDGQRVKTTYLLELIAG